MAEARSKKFRLPLKLKLSFLITLLIALSVLLVGDFLLDRAETSLTAQITKRGLTIARDLAASARNPLVTHDELTLNLMVKDALRDEDVSYAIVVDEDNKVVAHNDLNLVGSMNLRSRFILSLLRIPEILGLPFGRPETPKPRPDTPPAAGPKPEPTEEGPYVNPTLAEAKEAIERGEYTTALTTLDQFLAQNPRNGEAVDLKRAALLQQGKTLMDQNKLGESLAAFTQLARLSPKDGTVSSLMSNVRGRLIQQHYNQGIRLYREEKLPATIAEWLTVLQYDPAHEGAKRNIEQAERLLKGLEARQQKQGR